MILSFENKMSVLRRKGYNFMGNIIFPSEPPRPIKKPAPKAPFEKGSLWGTHDPAIYHDPVTGNYYVYSTNALCQRSTDLISWEQLGKVVPNPPKDSLEWVGGDAIWAPDIVKVGDEYRLYCSNSTFGSQQSCIFLATSNNAEGPFEPQGAVLKTSKDLPVNAIDANIIEDHISGEQYMIYGSFWGGCHLLKLNKDTGYAAEDGIGLCVAKRPLWTEGAIEGPYIKYNDKTGYYYLFVSYASLNSDYNIRVGRSKYVTGPYLDYNGREMTDTDDSDCTTGYMVACGYHFDDSQSYMGPGHNSVLYDNDGEWYLVCHIREHNFKNFELSTMQIHKIFWTDDGWPVVSPTCYAGEKTQPFELSDLIGKYERIKLTPTVPQGVLNSTPLQLFENESATMASITHMHWKLKDPYTFVLNFGPNTEEYKISPAWDYELWKPTIVMTGKDQNGVCVWLKKR